jgi:general stress protein 26
VKPPIGCWSSITVHLFIAAVICLPGGTMAEQPTAGFAPDVVARLQDAKEIYVATERKNGTRSQVVPVWFGFMDDAIWFTTGPDSHKGKRVKQGSPMYVSVQGKDGPFIKTKVEIIKDGAIADRLGELYSKKYWIAWLGFFRPSHARNESGKTILLRLTPAG